MTNIAKKIGWAVKSWSPTIGSCEQAGQGDVAVGVPIEMPVGTITSERMKPGEPEGEEVDHHAGDDLVDPVGDAQHGVEQREQPARERPPRRPTATAPTVLEASPTTA